MKKVKNRTISVLILVGLTILALGFYTFRLVTNGQMWASSVVNSNVHTSRVLTVGTITDRNGIVLADVTDGRRTFSENEQIRRATLHVVGDPAGNIGTGALTMFSADLIGYNIVFGTYSRVGEGNQIALTIDANLNLAAYRALAGQRGSVIVKNFETGEILAMVSNPTFDPANPPVITDDDPAFDGVFLNRTISSALTPGSTFKLITAVAAIENIDDIFERRFSCDGTMHTLRGNVYCMRAHGNISFEEAMSVSCNVAFGTLAIELGADTLESYVRQLGLSEPTTVGGIATVSGNFDRAAPGTADLAWSGVGQFTNTVCPAAMLRFVGAVANGGVAVEMSIIQRQGVLANFRNVSETRIMSEETARKLGEIIDYSVHIPGALANFPGLNIHAKTGTAELGNDLAPHAWFAGYITNPGFPLAFVVVVEHGGGGFAVAAPVANAVLQAAVG